MKDKDKFWSESLRQEEDSLSAGEAIKGCLTVVAGALFGIAVGVLLSELLCSCSTHKEETARIEQSASVSVEKETAASNEWLSQLSADNVELKARIDSVVSGGKTYYGVWLNAEMEKPTKVDASVSYAHCSQKSDSVASAKADTHAVSVNKVEGFPWIWLASVAAIMLLACLSWKWIKKQARI